MRKNKLNALIQMTVKYSPYMAQADAPVITCEALTSKQPCNAEGWEDTTLTLSCVTKRSERNKINSKY